MTDWMKIGELTSVHALSYEERETYVEYKDLSIKRRDARYASSRTIPTLVCGP